MCGCPCWRYTTTNAATCCTRRFRLGTSRCERTRKGECSSPGRGKRSSQIRRSGALPYGLIVFPLLCGTVRAISHANSTTVGTRYLMHYLFLFSDGAALSRSGQHESQHRGDNDEPIQQSIACKLQYPTSYGHPHPHNAPTYIVCRSRPYSPSRWSCWSIK